MLVEADAVEPQFIEFFPGIEMLGIRSHGDGGIEMTFGKGMRQLAVYLQMFDIFAVWQQIEDENFHPNAP